MDRWQYFSKAFSNGYIAVLTMYAFRLDNSGVWFIVAGLFLLSMAMDLRLMMRVGR